MGIPLKRYIFDFRVDLESRDLTYVARDLNTSEGTLGAGPFLGAVDEAHER